MPRRIPIVLFQSPVSTPQRRSLEEQVVTRLLFETGMDVNVVEHLADLEPGGTGLLCLEGLTGDLVLLGWLDRAEAERHLRALQIAGRFGRTTFDPELTDHAQRGGRTLYYLDLQRCASAEPVLSEVLRIREDLTLPTVPLAGLTAPLSPAAPPPAVADRAVPPAAPPQSSAAAVPLTRPQGQTALSERELERLVDELDELQL